MTLAVKTGEHERWQRKKSAATGNGINESGGERDHK